MDLIKSMINGHYHLQMINIAHRDIKPENILIMIEEEQLNFKICDVGVNKNIKTQILIQIK